MERKTLLYSEDFDLLELFQKVGDYCNVYIPSKFITVDYVSPDGDQTPFGSRPYSPLSDLVGIVCHMGILFPRDKPKKQSPIVLWTSPSALKFGTAKMSFEDTQSIDDAFKFYGVVVTVVAKPPLEEYPAGQGYCFDSQETDEYHSFSVDIIDFHFVSEFEPVPECSEDSDECIMHVDNPDTIQSAGMDDNDAAAWLPYNPEFFTSADLLFEDYNITFVTQDDEYEIHMNSGTYTVTHRYNEEEESLDGIAPSELIFSSNSVRIRDVEITPQSFVISPK